MKEIEEAVLLVDVQNDFCPGGNLAVKDGNQVVEPLNKLISYAHSKGWRTAASRDWHPEKSVHFDIWPKHCVQDTFGAGFHPDLNIEGVTVFSKGMGDKDNGYSPFEGTDSQGQGLGKFLENVKKIYIGGLATDYCVRAAVLDAIKLEYEVFLMPDAIKAVNLNVGDGEKAIEEMISAGATSITVSKLLERNGE
jgi:nicotinamidase/pyrazinamidase